MARRFLLKSHRYFSPRFKGGKRLGGKSKGDYLEEIISAKNGYRARSRYRDSKIKTRKRETSMNEIIKNVFVIFVVSSPDRIEQWRRVREGFVLKKIRF